MTERLPCPQCKTTLVPSNHICVDCAFPAPQARQDYFEQQEAALQASWGTLRDRFATAALTSLISCEKDINLIARDVYLAADAMLAARKLPESG